MTEVRILSDTRTKRTKSDAAVFQSGEIDIWEGINNVSTAQYTLHTKNGCTQSNNTALPYSGDVISTNCYYGANGNQGCATNDNRTASYVRHLNSRLKLADVPVQIRCSVCTEWWRCLCNASRWQRHPDLVLAGQSTFRFRKVKDADVDPSARKCSIGRDFGLP